MALAVSDADAVAEAELDELDVVVPVEDGDLPRAKHCARQRLATVRAEMERLTAL